MVTGGDPLLGFTSTLTSASGKTKETQAGMVSIKSLKTGYGFEMLPVYPSPSSKEEGLDKMHLRHRAECTQLPEERAPSVQGGCFCGHSAPWNSYRIPLSAPDSSSRTILSLSHSTDRVQKGEGMKKSMVGTKLSAPMIVFLLAPRVKGVNP